MASSDTTPEGKRPLRILAVVEWYPPAYKAGGPIPVSYTHLTLPTTWLV